MKNFIRYEPGFEEEKFGIFFILGEIDILVDRFCTNQFVSTFSRKRELEEFGYKNLTREPNFIDF